MKNLKPKRIVDLSHVLYNCMPMWPTQSSLLYEQMANETSDGATLHIIRQMTTHTGTHVDLPIHFIVGGKTVDQFPIETFAGEGAVIDLSYKKASEEITVEDLEAYDEEIKANDVLMLHTGWDKKFGFNPEYLFEWPYLVEETARYLINKNVKALGVDTLSVGGWDGELPNHGPIARKGSPAKTHRILLGAEIVLIEAVRNLDLVLAGKPTQRAYFIYPPIALKGTDGGPCRAVALLFEYFD